MNLIQNLFAPIMLVVALYDGTVGIGLAALHHLAARVGEDLEDPVLPVLVGQGTHLHPLEGDDSLWGVLCRVLEVVQAAVVQNEPTSLPVLPVTALQRFRVQYKAFILCNILGPGLLAPAKDACLIHLHVCKSKRKKSVGGLNIHRYLIYIIISAGSSDPAL